MAATKVIRFHFRAQAFPRLHPTSQDSRTCSSIHRRYRGSHDRCSRLDRSLHFAGTRVSRHFADRSTERSSNERKGRFQCKRQICTKQFSW